MRRHEHSKLRYYTFESMPEVIHGISTRLGGVSSAPFASLNLGFGRSDPKDSPDNVLANRRRWCQALAVPYSDLITPRQVHGVEIVQVTQAMRGCRDLVCDGLITDVLGVPLMLRYADCVPLLVYDPIHRVVGLTHAGWRGTVSGIAQALVQAPGRAFGSNPAELLAGIGPAIGPCCYEVGPEVVARVERAFANPAHLLRPGRRERPHLDLWQANVQAFTEAGVRQVEVAEVCTACHTDEFFSYRAEAQRTGLHSLLACLV